jgi:hypothetical protein
VMGYLKQKHNYCLIFDPTYLKIDIFPSPPMIRPSSMVM